MRRQRRFWAVATTMLCGVGTAAAAPPPPGAVETHSFKVTATVSYRCYGGYGPKKAVDSRTKVTCDNKTETKNLFDKVMSIKIADEPDPEDSKDLEGSWEQTIEFKGRRFMAAVSLFKFVSSSKTPYYTLRLVARDDEPGSRQTAVFAQAGEVRAFNKLMIQYGSAGQPEEIDYQFSIEPSDGQSR